MFFKKKKIQVALVEGRNLIMIALYHVISSTLIAILKNEYSETELKEAAANVVNRITFRNENRPDPRKLGGNLANEITEISTLQMIKEAVSIVLILDHFIGDFKNASNIDRIAEAKKIAEVTSEIINQLNPEISKPEDIYTFSLNISERLNSVADI